MSQPSLVSHLPRFWRKIRLELVHPELGPCWVWTAYTEPRGYGRFGIGRKVVRAYRYSYQVYRGPIPEGLEPDHLCQNKPCVNPWHLELVTHKENLRRGPLSTNQNVNKTHCKRGHEFTEKNTRIYQGKRNCRSCDRKGVRTREASNVPL